MLAAPPQHIAEIDPNQIYTAQDLARACGFSPSTLNRLLDQGFIPFMRLTPKGWRRIYGHEFLSFIERSKVEADELPDNETALHWI